jgi:hypothetical protein
VLVTAVAVPPIIINILPCLLQCGCSKQEAANVEASNSPTLETQVLRNIAATFLESTYQNAPSQAATAMVTIWAAASAYSTSAATTQLATHAASSSTAFLRMHAACPS